MKPEGVLWWGTTSSVEMRIIRIARTTIHGGQNWTCHKYLPIRDICRHPICDEASTTKGPTTSSETDRLSILLRSILDYGMVQFAWPIASSQMDF